VAGRLDEAIPLLEHTLADSERILGAEHPNTLGARNNLANAYRSAGRLGEAIPLYERTLADRERILGAEHPDTLASRNNLAIHHRRRVGQHVWPRSCSHRTRLRGFHSAPSGPASGVEAVEVDQ
jgi:hypothetical protein